LVGEDAMPFLVSLLGSSDPFSRGNAVEALPLRRANVARSGRFNLG
jgi:hypothetical protein